MYVTYTIKLVFLSSLNTVFAFKVLFHEEIIFLCNLSVFRCNLYKLDVES